MKIFAISLLTACTLGLTARAQTAQRLTATKANDYGITFNLPATMIDVTVEAEITVKKPGEFYKYAPKYLHVDNPITREDHSARLLSAVVYTHGIADQEEVYNMTFKNGNAVYVLVADNGTPLAINTDELPKTPLPDLPEPVKAAPTPLETPAARQVVSQEMLQSQSTAKRAELAAQAIFAIRQIRSELITGQADNMPPDGKSLQLMLDNLQAQEDALTAMFVGTTQVYTQVETYRVDPAVLDGKAEARLIVARISPLDGIVDSTDLSGAPVYLTLKVLSRGEMPVNDKGQELPFPKNGIPYRIPGEVQATVSYDGSTAVSSKLELSQLGIVYGLNPNSFTDRKAPIFIQYNPSTGSLLRQGPAQQ